MRFTGDPAHADLGRIQRIGHGLASRLGTNSRSSAAGSAGDPPSPAAGVTGQMDRRKFLVAGTAGAAGAVLFSGPSLTALLTGPSVKGRTAAATPATAGQWTAPFNLTLVSIHAVVLRTGNVLLFSRPTDETVGSDAVLWNPASGSITNIALSYQRDIFCSGMTVLPAGRVFIAGGHIYQGATLGTHQGVSNTTIFAPGSNAWTEGPLMDVPRWYPTVAQIGDGTVRILGGTTNPGTNAVTIDAYDSSANPSLTVLPSTANKSMSTYPRVKLTTTGLLAFTNTGTTYFLNPATAAWTTGPKLNSGTRNVNDTSVLLPGLTQIMEIGGTTPTGTTATAEILDLSVSPLAWKPAASMSFGRVWANTVLLADGTVLVIGGGASGDYTGPVLTPELYDPVAATWTQMAAQTAPRMYHSTAVLLPDGRVLRPARAMVRCSRPARSSPRRTCSRGRGRRSPAPRRRWATTSRSRSQPPTSRASGGWR